MDKQKIARLLDDYRNGVISQDEALKAFQEREFEDMGFAKVDYGREYRKGFPEVVYGAGKTVAQSVAIIEKLYQNSKGNILATRVSREVYEGVKEVAPQADYHEGPRLLTIYKKPRRERGCVAVLAAGTSDLSVAEEAALTAEVMDCHVERIYDVGVAGIHRLLAYGDRIAAAQVLIVVAGMDGALPSVVGGLYAKPLIAVPTSVGYGASFGGISALLAMLNSCAAGITVVNIDNGFGAGCAAALIVAGK